MNGDQMRLFKPKPHIYMQYSMCLSYIPEEPTFTNWVPKKKRLLSKKSAVH